MTAINGVIEIRAPGAAPRRTALPASAVMLGKKPGSGIAVPTARELADEHIVISPGRAGCHLALLPGVELQPSLRGRTFRQSDVVWGDEVTLGRTTLRFLGEKPATGPSKTVLGGVAFIALAVGWLLLSGEELTEAEAKERPPAPALFADSVACPVAGPNAAAQARQAEDEAAARTQRYHYDALDGVKAVRIYMLASKCYADAGDAAGAARTRKIVETWKVKVDAKYRTHDLQLRLALERKDDKRAKSELAALLPFVRDRTGPYVAWLSSVRKTLTSK